MANIIKLLPDHVANQIAAGEVVQRPASVIKELLENAIDAEATSVKLIFKDAGKTLLQVIDDGKGMSITDARMSFERHATSKITDAGDLFRLNTKGFRGEALASIAAVAQVELKTRARNSDLGTVIRIAGSKIEQQEPIAVPVGTSVAVKNLFFNIPARRNFLKSNTVETRHIIDEMQRVALAHPDIAFTCFHNGSEIFNLPKSNFRQRIVNVFGSKTNEKLVPVTEETDLLKVDGFVIKPQFSKKSKGEQFFFVNKRFIKSPYLNHAIMAAFEGLLPEKTRASYFLFLDVDPKTIDINIHPTKTEIKFDDEHTLYAILRSAVKHSLGQFQVAPILDFEREHAMDTPYHFKDKVVATPEVSVDRDFNPFNNESSPSKHVNAYKPSFEKTNTEGWENMYDGLADAPKQQFSSLAVENIDAPTELFTTHNGLNAGGVNISQQYSESSTHQLHNKYIISPIKSGVLIIDQHRAHQRVLYEKLLRTITTSEAVSQQLLFPLHLDYAPSEIELIKQSKESLENTGFVFGGITAEAIEVKGIPIALSESEVPIVIEQLLSDLEQHVPDAGFSQTDILAKSIAKSTAVKVGEFLDATSREHLVHTLFACKEPNKSPNNKTTFITLSQEELDRKFK